MIPQSTQVTPQTTMYQPCHLVMVPPPIYIYMDCAYAYGREACLCAFTALICRVVM